MTKVFAEISTSLDGFVTGPDAGIANGLGTGGEPLHEWAFDSGPVDAQLLQDAVDRTGAVVMGRNLFDVIDGPDGWSDELGYGGAHATQPPIFVVTHEAPTEWRLGDRFTFVTDGLAAAVARAADAAGEGAVVVMGGGAVVRQSVELGLVDELHVHLAPIILGGGTRLFGPTSPIRLDPLWTKVGERATHLAYAVPRRDEAP